VLLLLDAASGRVKWRRNYPAGPAAAFGRVAFAPNGNLFTSAQQDQTLEWDAQTGRVVRRFPIGGQPAVSADGTVLALASNSANVSTPSSKIDVLDIQSGRYRVLPSGLPSAWINDLVVTPDGKRIVGGDFDGNVYVWDLATGSIQDTFAGPQGVGSGATLLDPRELTVLSAAQDGSVLVSDVGGRRRLGQAFQWNTPAESCPSAPCFVVNRTSTLMATDQSDGSVALIDLRTLRRTATLPARNGPLANAIAFFPDGHTLLTGGDDGNLTLWDVRTHTVLQTIRLGQPVWWAAVSPDGRLLAAQTAQSQGSTTSQVQVRTMGGRKLWSNEVSDGTGGLYFAPDGRALAALGCCTSRSTVVSWDPRSGEQLFLEHPSPHATAIAYSPDARALAIGTEGGQVRFLSPDDGRAVARPLQVSGGQVEQISFAPNGRRLVIDRLTRARRCGTCAAVCGSATRSRSGSTRFLTRHSNRTGAC
jgi:WD40 repeat protein